MTSNLFCRWKGIIGLVVLFTVMLFFVNLFTMGSHQVIAQTPGLDAITEWVPGEMVIKFKEEVEFHFNREKNTVQIAIASIDSLNANFQIKYIEPIFKTASEPGIRGMTKLRGDWKKLPNLSTIYKFVFEKNADILSIVAEYIKNPNVVYAEPNYRYLADGNPNDPDFGKQWALHKIHAQPAWHIKTGDPSIIIGFIDTGVDWNHPDLATNLWMNPGEIPNNGVDDDGNGFVDDVRGWDFVDAPRASFPATDEDCLTRDNDPMDRHGHGTLCSGIVSATMNNKTGIAGLAGNCKIMAVRAGYKRIDGQAVLESDDAAAAIKYAADNGARVLNISWGGAQTSYLIQDVINYAIALNCVVVAAAGNDNTNRPHYPAALENVIAVAATDANDQKASFSNFGSWVDVSAPGVDIYSTYLNNSCAPHNGTSAAASLVSGLAALILSQNPYWLNSQVASQIINRTDNIDALNPDHAGLLGSGRINAQKAFANRVVLSEIFTTTGCSNCPEAEQAIEQLATEYGSTRLVVLEYHDYAAYSTPETEERALFYGVADYPINCINGLNHKLSLDASSQVTAYQRYRKAIDYELANPNLLHLDAQKTVSGSVVTVETKVINISDQDIRDVRVHAVIYEDSGTDGSRFVVRDILPIRSITQLVPGDTLFFIHESEPLIGVDMTHVNAVVFVQDPNSPQLEVLQATVATPKERSVTLSSYRVSQQISSGEIAQFKVTLTNQQSFCDTFELNLSQDFSTGWKSEFCMNGVCYSQKSTVILNAHESKSIDVKIIPAGTARSNEWSEVTLAVMSRSRRDVTDTITLKASIPSGILLYVINPAGEPANQAQVELFSDTSGSAIFRDYTNDEGKLSVEVPEGNYTLVVSSSRDHFLYVKENVVSPSVVSLDSSNTAVLELRAKQLNGNPLDNAEIWLCPFKTARSKVGYTDADGTIKLHVTKNISYTLIAISYKDFYYLVEPNVSLVKPRSMNLNASRMPTGKININIDGFPETYLILWGSHSFWGPGMEIPTNSTLILSEGRYHIPLILQKQDDQNNLWEFEIWRGNAQHHEIDSSIFDIKAGDAQNLTVGGKFNLSVSSEEKKSYHSGELINFTNRITDSYGHPVVRVAYYPSKLADTSDFTLVPKRVFPRSDWRSLVENQPPEYTEVYPRLRIIDPNRNLIADESLFNNYTTFNYQLSHQTLKGIYSAILSLNSGPHQGIIADTTIFTVGTGIFLNCPGLSQTVFPGQTAWFEVTLVNSQSVTDTFTLNLTKTLPIGWNAEFYVDSVVHSDSATVALLSNESKEITVRIVPSEMGDSGVVTLSAISQNNSSIHATIDLKTTVSVGSLTLSCTHNPLTIPMGAVARFKVALKYEGLIADTFHVSLDPFLPDQWQAELGLIGMDSSQTSVPVVVEPDSTQTMEVKIRTSTTATSSDSGWVVVNVISNTNPTLTEAITLHVATTFIFSDIGFDFGSYETYGLALGDVDNDGDLDLVEANYGANKVYLNDGTGQFTDSGQNLGSDNTNCVALGDVDGDGDLDLVAGNVSANKLYLNDSTGLFIDSGQSLGSASTQSICLVDVDSDGDLDVIAANFGPDKVYLNNGQGVFMDSGQDLGNTNTYIMRAGDIDGDGDVDLVTSEHEANYIWKNDGYGQFTVARQKLGDNTPTMGLALADVDADGDLDIIEGNTDGQPSRIYFNNGNGLFTRGSEFTQQSVRDLAIGDVDNDGDLDLVVGGLNACKVFLNDGAGEFSALTLSYSTMAYGVALGDVDNDGDLDLICGTLGEPNHQYKNIQSVVKSNTAPTPPSELNTSIQDGAVAFNWNKGDDIETPSSLLTYNLSIGTASHPGSVVSEAIPAGYGNMGPAMSYTLKNLKPGRYYCRIQTVDTGFLKSAWSSRHSFKISSAPQILSLSPPSDTTISEGDTLIFTVRAMDADGDSLSYRWAINGAMDSSATDTVFVLVTGFYSAGVDTITAIVSDADSAISHCWLVTIKSINQPPYVTYYWPEADTAINEGDSVTFRVSATDVDGDTLRYSWQVNGVRDSTATDTLYTYATDFNTAGVDTIMVIISDADTSTIVRWLLKVKNTNRAPRIIFYHPPADTIINEGDTLSFTVRGADADGDSLIYRWFINHTMDSTATDTTFLYISNFSSAGVDTILAMVSDVDTTVWHQWLVRVTNINRPPLPPKVIAPTDGISIDDTDRFIWSAAFDPDIEDTTLTYLIQVATDSAFYDIVSTDSVFADTSIILKNLSGFDKLQIDRKFFWRVKALDHRGGDSDFTDSGDSFIYRPTSVRLSRFYAEAREDGRIHLLWETSYERNNAGFNLYRSHSRDGNYSRINKKLITGKSAYSYVDEAVEAGKTYYYRLEDVSTTGQKTMHEPISVTAPVPDNYALFQNYPNPFNLTTSIKYQLPKDGHVTIKVYNILGRVVRTLVEENKKKGFYSVVWDGRDNNGRFVGSGIYFYQMVAGSFRDTKKMTILQ